MKRLASALLALYRREPARCNTYAAAALSWLLLKVGLQVDDDTVLLAATSVLAVAAGELTRRLVTPTATAGLPSDPFDRAALLFNRTADQAPFTPWDEIEPQAKAIIRDDFRKYVLDPSPLRTPPKGFEAEAAEGLAVRDAYARKYSSSTEWQPVNPDARRHQS